MKNIILVMMLATVGTAVAKTASSTGAGPAAPSVRNPCCWWDSHGVSHCNSNCTGIASEPDDAFRSFER